MLDNLRNKYHKFPVPFWVLILAIFIDSIGYTLIFPFFSLYITEKFGVGMTEAGGLLAIFAVSGLFGIFIGGALADKFGRRSMIIFGLVFSALSSVAMGFVNELSVFYSLAIVVGFLSNFGGPARDALVADLVEEDKRAEAYGFMRVVANLAWVIGPVIGGFMASRSYLTLFILDAITSLIVAFIFFKMIPETNPALKKVIKETNSLLHTLKEYGGILKDKIFNIFLISSILMNFVYLQLYSTLSVYLRDTHGVSPANYGILMSINAIIVVFLQIWVSSKTSKQSPMMMMALGTFIYAIAFPIYGFASTYIMFILAIILITFGEMIVMPVATALVAKLAPEDMRGRYMAMFGFSWHIPSIGAPIIAGLVLDNLNPSLLWYLCGIIASVATLGFYLIHFKTEK